MRYFRVHRTKPSHPPRPNTDAYNWLSSSYSERREWLPSLLWHCRPALSREEDCTHHLLSISLGHSKLRIMEFVSFKPPSVIVELAVSQCQFPAFTLVRNAERQYSYHLISNIAYTAPGTSPVRIPIRKNGLRKIYHPPAFRQRPATGLYIAADRLPGKPCPGKFLQTVLGIAAGQIEQIRLLRNSPVLLRIEKVTVPIRRRISRCSA